MHFDQDGTYNLVYIAEDECGNKTLAERVVEVFSLRTVLYPDGTLIINEKGIDQASNEALHGGTATNVYIPFDPNGATAFDRYEFVNAGARPWHSESASVKSVEIGSAIAPYSLRHWFNGFTVCESITHLDLIDTSRATSFRETFYQCQALTSLDLSNFDTSNVESMQQMFYSCSALTNLDISNFDTSNVTNMSYMFNFCRALTSLDLSGFDTSKVTNMLSMFASCSALTSLNVSSFDTSSVTTMANMFKECSSLATLDVSNFDTSRVTNMSYMFNACTQLVTIFASSQFVTDQATNSYMMFYNSKKLVGGAGTTYSSSHSDKAYAHIDGGTSNPGYFTAKA